MPNIRNIIRGVINQITQVKSPKKTTKKSGISQLAQSAMEIEKTSEPKPPPNVASETQSNAAVQDLFDETVHLSGHLASEDQGSPEDLATSLMDLLSDRKLNKKDKARIKGQIEEAVKYLRKNGESLRDEAKTNKKTLYIRPGDMGEGLGKKRGFFGRKGLKARYRGAHIQVTPEGTIYIIPKHPKLSLGEGSYKRVRTALEVDQNNQPKRLVAFANLPIHNEVNEKFNKNEVKVIKQVLDELNQADPEGEGYVVRLSRYTRGGLKKDQMILPLANRGDLRHARIQKEEIPQVLRGIVDSTATLHHLEFVNGDIKPENFLLDGDQIMALDLGFACQGGEAKRISRVQGTPNFMAPEIFQASSDAPYNGYQADIFALGRTLDQFGSKRSSKIVDIALYLNRRGQWVFDEWYYQRHWEKFKPRSKLDVLVKQMIHRDPKQRPDIETVQIALELVLNPEVSKHKLAVFIDNPKGLRLIYEQERIKSMTSLFFEQKESKPEAQKEVEQQVEKGLKYIDDHALDLRKQAQEKGEAIYIRASEYGGGKIGEGSNEKARYEGAHIQVNPDGKIYLIPKHPDLWINKGALKKLRMALELDSDNKPQKVVAFASIRSISGSFDVAEREVGTINELLTRRDRQNKPVGFQVFKDLGQEKKAKAKVILPYANMGGIRARKLHPDDKMSVMNGCVKWIQFMHNNGFVNLDIKEANFLGFRSEDGEIDILGLDLDQARQVDPSSGAITPSGGTLPYMSPEFVETYLNNKNEADLFEEKKTCDGFKADIFALGKTLLFVEQRGYDQSFNFIEGDPDTGAPISFDKGKYIRTWNHFDPESPMQYLAKAMIHPNPKRRPDINLVSDNIDRINSGTINEESLHKVLQDFLSPVDEPATPEVESLADHYTIHEISHEDAENKLNKQGAWLIRKDESGTHHLYFSDADRKISSELFSTKIEDVKGMIDTLVEEGSIEEGLQIKS